MRKLLRIAAASPLLAAIAALLLAVGPFLGVGAASALRAASILYVATYALLALLLAEPARRRRDPWWGAVALLAAASAAAALAPTLLPRADALLAFLLRAAAPVALAVAGARWMRTRGEVVGGVSRLLLGLYAVALVVQIASHPSFTPQGVEDLYVYAFLQAVTGALLLGAFVALSDDAHRSLRVGGAVVGFAGALVAATAMATLLALDGWRPFGGIRPLAFAAHALGLGALVSGLALVVLGLARGPRGAKAHDEAASMEPRAHL